MVIQPGSNFNATDTAAGKTKQTPVNADAGKDSESSATQSTSQDHVSLSLTGQAIAKLEAKVDASSEVDSQKVADVKATLNSGSYQIDTSAIADKILGQEGLLG